MVALLLLQLLRNVPCAGRLLDLSTQPAAPDFASTPVPGPRGPTVIPTWTFAADSGIVGSPAIDAAGKTLYFPSIGGYLYALDLLTGVASWSTPFLNTTIMSAVILSEPEETLYFLTRNAVDNTTSTLMAVDLLSGSTAWSYGTFLSATACSPALSLDRSMVLLTSLEGYMFAVNTSSGEVVWTTEHIGAPVLSCLL